MQELQRRLLMGEEGQRIAMLRQCCKSSDGQAWCRDRFDIYEVLEWMWKEGQGDFALLLHWRPDPALEGLYRALVPEGYQAARLARVLFPTPGRYKLDDNGITGVRNLPLPAELIPLLRRRVRDFKPPPGYRLRETNKSLELLPSEEAAPRILLSQGLLEESGAQVVAYGAKDTGEMGGGAAGALLVAAGELLEQASRVELARCKREIGEAYLTPAFGELLQRGTRWVCHIISIIKHTDQGAWCPHPDKLEGGVLRALTLADHRGASTIAFSALGTGEGRVAPDLCARLMIGAARRYVRERNESTLRITFCLANERDYQAFKKVLSG